MLFFVCTIPLLLALLVVLTRHPIITSSEPLVREPSLLELGGKQQTEYWKNIIMETGSVAAYQTFGALVVDEPVERQHTLVHFFSAALYEVEGYSGIRVCDNQFLGGCSHEIISRSILEGGIGSVKEFKKNCDNLSDPFFAEACRHSLGHGLTAWFGYEEKNLAEALRACKAYVLAEANPFGGCYSGVFMEFLLRNLVASEIEAYRRAPEKEYYALCDSLPAEFHKACAFQAFQSWVVSAKGETLEDFKHFGELCRGFKTREFVDYCYMGIGDHLPINQEMPATTIISRCKAISSDARDQLLCRAFAALTTFSKKIDTSVTKELCVGLLGPSLEYCNAYATGIADYDHFLNLPEEI